jgi:hypothetical protein
MINVAYLIKKIIKIIGAFPLASLGVGLVPGSAFASVLRCTSLSKIDPITEYSSQRSFQLVPPSAPSTSLMQSIFTFFPSLSLMAHPQMNRLLQQ